MAATEERRVMVAEGLFLEEAVGEVEEEEEEEEKENMVGREGRSSRKCQYDESLSKHIKSSSYCQKMADSMLFHK